MSCWKIEFEKDIRLVLSNKIVDNLKVCVEHARPNEACGIIFGEIKQVKKKEYEDEFIYYYQGNNFECILSDKESTVSFLIENIEKLHETIQNKIKELNLGSKKRLISIFHSHPSGAHPSSMDLKQMRLLDNFSNLNHNFISKAFKNLIWLIMDGINYDLKGFIYLNSEFFQIEVEIKEGN